MLKPLSFIDSHHAVEYVATHFWYAAGAAAVTSLIAYAMTTLFY